MANLNLDILQNSAANRSNTNVFKDLHLDLVLAATNSNQLAKTLQITDIAADYNLQAVYNSISNIILTSPGQKPLNPTFGMGFRDLVFLPVTVNRARIIGDAILAAITKFEPRVTIVNINVTPVPDQNQYQISFTIIVPKFSVQQTTFKGILQGNNFYTITNTNP